ncbi:single-stranded DNA-binding protein [Hominisplanchenecus sp.]|uniref:single-stranded DNA-binding protein n=1 Tax=Hominisplanchenecus sp. TaxID=3038130 RepID=UPI003995A5FE
MNNITIIGRLAQDPTVGKAKSNGEPVTLFNIASDSSFPNKTDFLHCMANYQTGKYVAQYGAKGMTIYVEGELTTGEHANRDGVKIQDFTIMVRKVKFLSKNPNQQSGQAPRTQQHAPQTSTAPQNNGNYQQRPAQQQTPTPNYRNSASIYQDACRSGQQPRGNGFAPGGNGYPTAPAYAQPKTDFLEIPEGVDDCPFN